MNGNWQLAQKKRKLLLFLCLSLLKHGFVFCCTALFLSVWSPLAVSNADQKVTVGNTHNRKSFSCNEVFIKCIYRLHLGSEMEKLQ